MTLFCWVRNGSSFPLSFDAQLPVSVTDSLGELRQGTVILPPRDYVMVRVEGKAINFSLVFFAGTEEMVVLKVSRASSLFGYGPASATFTSERSWTVTTARPAKGTSVQEMGVLLLSGEGDPWTAWISALEKDLGSEVARGLKVSDICVPGSHDSGTFSLSNVVSPYSSQIAGRLASGTIKAWAQTQSSE